MNYSLLYKKNIIQTPILVYDYQEELIKRNLKNDTRINNLINPVKPTMLITEVKFESMAPSTRKRVKNRILPKK